MIFPGESREDGKGAPGEEALRRVGQGQEALGRAERPEENVNFPGESGGKDR